MTHVRPCCGSCVSAKLNPNKSVRSKGAACPQNQPVPRSAYSSAAHPHSHLIIVFHQEPWAFNQRGICVLKWKCLTSIHHKSCTYLGQVRKHKLFHCHFLTSGQSINTLQALSVCLVFSSQCWAIKALFLCRENPESSFLREPITNGLGRLSSHTWAHSDTHDPEPHPRLHHHLLT